MKRLVLFFIIFAVSSYSEEELKSEEDLKQEYYDGKTDFIEKDDDSEGSVKKREMVSIAFKPGYFWMQDKVGRNIYKGGYISLLEVTARLYKGLYAWIESGYFHKRKYFTSANVRTKTTLTHVPVSVGVNYSFYICSWLDCYLKLGPNWVYVKTKLPISNVKKVITKNVFGVTMGTGFKIKFWEYLFVEPFVNYLYDKKTINDSSSSTRFKRYLGGIQTGIGIGARF